ncbi:unnamed protein product [Effrenium voratum]|nr:unnamed protein product [Effrenium voratum]
MAMMRTRTKSRGMCLCLLGIALALLVQPSTDFARGVPGLKDSILAKQHPLHAGVARRAGAAQEDNSGQVVAEADRVLEDNGTAKETKAVLRRWSSTWVGVARAVKVLSSGKAQKIYPGKWTLSGLKDELQQKLREFVEEDLLLARQQLKPALAQQEAAQEQEVKAVARLEKAEESGTKEEMEKAERKVQEAERKVEKAERKVEKAERKVERAKKEVKEAKASGRTKESEADGQQAAVEAILSTSWTVCQPAAMKPTLIGREEAKRELLGYICGVRNVTNSTFWEIAPPLGKSSVMVTAGVKGIGKTRLLHEMCTTWLSETAARAALRVDLHGSTWHGRKDPTQAFSQVLLRYAGMRPDDAAWCSEALPWEKVMWALRRKLGLADDALLLVGVDELIELEKKYGSTSTSLFISTIMQAQDESLLSGHRPVVFIWTALVESYFKKRASDSGRKVRLISLTGLPPEALNLVPQKIRRAFEATAGRKQLLRQILGHPRLMFDALQDAFSTCGLPETTSALVQFRKTMISIAKLDHPEALKSDEVRLWFSPSATLPPGMHDDLASRGLVHAARFGDKCKSVLHPLVLQSWADRHREPLANQIKKMFEEDSVLETTHEKKFEAVMLHFDAAVRLALEKESCTLEQLFPGANLKPESLRAVRVMPGLQYSGDSVVELDSFDDVDEVMSSLEYGSIVVSQKRTEKGIEYLVPWTVPRKDHRQLLRRSLQPTGPGDKDPNAHLLILGVQTKYVQEFVGKWPSVEDKAQKALAGLRAEPRVLQALPIFYTTEIKKEGRSLDNPNVYFSKAGLAELLLERAGPLRLFFEKLGRPLQNKLADFG